MPTQVAPKVAPPVTPTDGKRVLAAKVVELALITYIDEYNVQQVQLALVGDNQVHLIESRGLGISKNSTPQGTASEWLKKGVFTALGREG